MKRMIVLFMVAAILGLTAWSALGDTIDIGPVHGSAFDVHGFISFSGSGTANTYMAKDVWIRPVTATDSVTVSLWRLTGSTYARVLAPDTTGYYNGASGMDSVLTLFGSDWVHIQLSRPFTAVYINSPSADGAIVYWR